MCPGDDFIAESTVLNEMILLLLCSSVLSGGIGEDCEDEDADVVGIDGSTTGSTSANRSEINSQIEIVGMRQDENGTESGGKQI